MLATLHNQLEKIARAAVWTGGAALMLCAIMVTLDVLSRKLFGITMSGADEITGYVFAASTTWAYSYCLLHRANIRIDALYQLFPRALQATLDVLGTLLLLVFMGVLTERAIHTLHASWTYGSTAVTTLTTPLWIPQLFWVAGLILLMASLILVAVYALSRLFLADFATVSRIAGVKSLQEEIADEAAPTSTTAHPTAATPPTAHQES
ncbi:MAG: TRAP transporter small permease [Cellvibrionales bacterium]|nr:TRAP transporter small permease [Cellvibrionales bacterium]